MKIQANTEEWRTPPSAPGKTAVVELSLAAAVEPDNEGVNCFNRGSVPLVSLLRPRELRIGTVRNDSCRGPSIQINCSGRGEIAPAY